jgi:hypothetical protein
VPGAVSGDASSTFLTSPPSGSTGSRSGISSAQVA